jgi:hypothetical protein
MKIKIETDREPSRYFQAGAPTGCFFARLPEAVCHHLHSRPGRALLLLRGVRRRSPEDGSYRGPGTQAETRVGGRFGYEAAAIRSCARGFRSPV